MKYVFIYLPKVKNSFMQLMERKHWYGKQAKEETSFSVWPLTLPHYLHLNVRVQIMVCA